MSDADRYFSGQQRFGDNNLISGDRSGNLLFGTRGKDKIRSRGGADTIIAGNGNDIIRSGGGKDIIDGGRGTNRVFGGKGRDGFHLRQNGHQIISDFQIGKDYFILNRSMDPHDLEFEDNGPQSSAMEVSSLLLIGPNSCLPLRWICGDGQCSARVIVWKIFY